MDVDNLKSIALLETHIAESDVVCIFLTRAFITSANCLRELVATLKQGKRLVVVVETDDNKGAPTVEDLQRELAQLRTYGTPEQVSAAEHLVGLATSYVEWHREKQFRYAALKALAGAVLAGPLSRERRNSTAEGRRPSRAYPCATTCISRA